ncbi:MAG: GNAT family N-acetyltransferase [Bacteroidales bacterium OttesenSCG-928-I14]|jgi:hypothetical protein|nr:GNAT family N-acetyltransferase [Bacteroidales bacterium OttesenSCG-928-I14]
MEKIINKIDRNIIKSELTREKLFRKTNKLGNEIYLFTAHDAPNLMREVGRLREEAFRYYGGGTGKSIDIDEFDTMEIPYRQLVVWSPSDEEILGGYRFRCGNEISFGDDGQPNNIATSDLFYFSKKFKDIYLPQMIELGRSFVSLAYQASRIETKGLFALDNLWDGLGALSVIDPCLRYFFGKVTMYETYNKEARDIILFFLDKYFSDKENLVVPIYPLNFQMDYQTLTNIFNKSTYNENYRILNLLIRKNYGINIPPLMSAYMNLSPSMLVFGTAINKNFGNVEETGILVDVCDIFENKKKRHIESFLQEKPTKKLISHIRKMISKSYFHLKKIKGK